MGRGHSNSEGEASTIRSTNDRAKGLRATDILFGDLLANDSAEPEAPELYITEEHFAGFRDAWSGTNSWVARCKEIPTAWTGEHGASKTFAFDSHMTNFLNEYGDPENKRGFYSVKLDSVERITFIDDVNDGESLLITGSSEIAKKAHIVAVESLTEPGGFWYRLGSDQPCIYYATENATVVAGMVRILKTLKAV